ncbi:MAG TPA: hypothetical protein VIV60_24290 [Polyangiaceae bacterium]
MTPATLAEPVGAETVNDSHIRDVFSAFWDPPFSLEFLGNARERFAERSSTGLFEDRYESVLEYQHFLRAAFGITLAARMPTRIWTLCAKDWRVKVTAMLEAERARETILSETAASGAYASMWRRPIDVSLWKRISFDLLDYPAQELEGALLLCLSLEPYAGQHQEYLPRVKRALSRLSDELPSVRDIARRMDTLATVTGTTSYIDELAPKVISVKF